MTVKRFSVFVGLFALLVLSACSGVGGYNYSGSYAGTINNSVTGAGSVNFSISQSEDRLAGTWQASFSADGSNGGSLFGIVNGDSLILELYPSIPTACPFNAVVNRNGDTLNGSYSAFNCSVAGTGTVEVQKQ